MKRAMPDVKTLLAARLADADSVPGHRKDGFRLAVIAESGAMRGVKTAAFCARLEEHGVSRCVDMWGGTSSGGIATTLAAAGCVRLGASVYADALGPRGFYNDGRSRRFIDFRRILREPVMDVAGLVDVVFDHVKPVDYVALQECSVPVWVTATERDGQPHVLRLDGQDKSFVTEALKATARVPLAAHDVGDFDVKWDGGLTGHNIPLEAAREMGATHVLVLRAYPDTAQEKVAGALEKFLIAPLLKRKAPDLHALMVTRVDKANEVLAKLRGDPTILTIALPDDPVGQAEQDVGKLWRAAVASWEHIGRELGFPAADIPSEWANARAYV